MTRPICVAVVFTLVGAIAAARAQPLSGDDTVTVTVKTADGNVTVTVEAPAGSEMTTETTTADRSAKSRFVGVTFPGISNQLKKLFHD